MRDAGIYPDEIPQADLRPASTVMRLERMGSFFPTRLSFMRSLTRRLEAEDAKVTRPIWEMDNNGYGRAVYSLQLGGFTYSLIAFSNRLDSEKRTDRVIAEAWDSAFVLYDGIPTREELDRLQANAPHQEAGRFLPSDLVLSRANKSLRLFDHIVECLSKGEQPGEDLILSIGYLMRTTAVYGNGKFGIADRAKIENRHGLGGPFQAEMLTVWLIRGFTHDLVEHVARSKNPDKFVALEPRLKRFLGIGNSTGLGMAPFLVSHPVLLNNWMMARETALARVRAQKNISTDAETKFMELVKRSRLHLEQWNVPDERQMDRINLLREEWVQVADLITPEFLQSDYAIEQLVNASSQWSIECQELIVAVVLEPFSDLVDGLEECMTSSGEPRLDPSMKSGELKQLVEQHFDWALGLDFSNQAAMKKFWYVSEEKLEPRLGSRFEEPGAELEQPFDIALRCQKLMDDLVEVDENQALAEFLIKYPEHRYIVRRIQLVSKYPFSEIRDNLVGENCLPIDMLRCKLSFFGASKFDPKSDRWTRITLYQGAPLFEDIGQIDADDWWLPVLVSK